MEAVYDLPDNRDYDYSEICGSDNLPEEFRIDKIDDYQNQGLEDITKYMCVFFSTTHGVNICNFLEGFKEKDYSGKEMGLKAIEKKLLDPKKGASIQSGPKLARDEKHLKSWFLVNEDNIKQAIYDGHPIVCGSNQLKWGWPCIEKSSYGHAVLIIGWNKDGYIIKNSYGKEKFKEGLNLLPYNLFNKLFRSKYALVDNPNDILLYKQKIMDNIDLEGAKKMFVDGFWNGKNPRAPVSRQEVMEVLYRVLQSNK